MQRNSLNWHSSKLFPSNCSSAYSGLWFLLSWQHQYSNKSQVLNNSGQIFVTKGACYYISVYYIDTILEKKKKKHPLQAVFAAIMFKYDYWDEMMYCLSPGCVSVDKV